MKQQYKLSLMTVLVLFSFLCHAQAEFKPLLLLPYEDYYIKGSYRFQSKKQGQETGEFEVLRKHGRDVYCKILSNGDAVTVPNGKFRQEDIQWPAKLCQEKLRMGDRDVFLGNEGGGGGIISIPEESNSIVMFCVPFERFLSESKILRDFSHGTIKELAENQYLLTQTLYGANQKVTMIVGPNGLINHADLDVNGEWYSSMDVEYPIDRDFPKRYYRKTQDFTHVYEFDEVLTGTAASEHPTSLTLLRDGMWISDNRFQYVNYEVTNGALLSDKEAFAMNSRIQQEVKARNAAREVALKESMDKASAASAASNDPHNMKDVPVTGESWGNRLRRIPNWAYGGAAVLFLGGWFVAASRRRRR